MTHTARQITFAARPEGQPGPDTFVTQEITLPALQDGQILCRNLWVSVDPYLRLKMYDRESYTPPLQIGEPIPGRSVAQIIESRAEGHAVGDLVAIQGGWADHAIVKARHAERVDPALADPTAWLGPLGMTGMTAYAGLLGIGRPKAGETVCVSAAAGAVGSIVGQIARIQGCRVVGIAGSDAKCAEATETLGFDACVNYRATDYPEALRTACPNGIDVYFENVGGAVSAAVMPLLNPFARVALCGLISQYNGDQQGDPEGLAEFMRWMLVRRLTVQGFIVSDIARNHPEFLDTMGGWLRSGQLRQTVHMWTGFDAIVPAFLGLLQGQNTGKSMIHIADPV